MGQFSVELRFSVAEDGAADVHFDLKRDFTLTDAQRSRIEMIMGGVAQAFGDRMYGMGYGEKDYPGPLFEEEEDIVCADKPGALEE